MRGAFLPPGNERITDKPAWDKVLACFCRTVASLLPGFCLTSFPSSCPPTIFLSLLGPAPSLVRSPAGLCASLLLLRLRIPGRAFTFFKGEERRPTLAHYDGSRQTSTGQAGTLTPQGRAQVFPPPDLGVEVQGWAKHPLSLFPVVWWSLRYPQWRGREGEGQRMQGKKEVCAVFPSPIVPLCTSYGGKNKNTDVCSSNSSYVTDQ